MRKGKKREVKEETETVTGRYVAYGSKGRLLSPPRHF